MNMHASRSWIEVAKPHLPQMVVRGWMAVDQGVAVASIFQAITPAHVSDPFILCYHVFGERTPRLERFNSFDQAQGHANKVLSGVKVIPRTLPGMGGGRPMGRG